MKELIRKFPSLALSFLLILALSTMILCFRNFQLRKALRSYQPVPVGSTVTFDDSHKKLTVTHISTIEKDFQLKPSYKFEAIPGAITYWGSKPSDITYPQHSILPYNKSDQSVLSSDNGYSDNQEGVSDNFLSQELVLNSRHHINPDSLVQVLIGKDNLQLALYSKQKNRYITQDYHIDLEKYKYNWTLESGLTYQKKLSLELYPYIEGSYSFLEKSKSIESGLKLKTRKLDYNIGLSINQDPRINPDIYYDVKFTISYRFNPWLRY